MKNIIVIQDHRQTGGYLGILHQLLFLLSKTIMKGKYAKNILHFKTEPHFSFFTHYLHSLQKKLYQQLYRSSGPLCISTLSIMTLSPQFK